MMVEKLEKQQSTIAKDKLQRLQQQKLIIQSSSIVANETAKQVQSDLVWPTQTTPNLIDNVESNTFESIQWPTYDLKQGFSF